MQPYWSDGTQLALPVGNLCDCRCGRTAAPGRRFVTGHNLRVVVRDEEYRRRVGEGQRRAWKTTQRRKELGSKRVDAHGYILVKTAHGQVRWEKEHVLVVQAEIGRALTRGEQVHHINGIKDDNRLENLLLCADNSDHMAVEASFKHLLADLLASGMVTFDRTDRRYRLA